MTDSEALMRYVQRRDPDAFRVMVERYQRLVYATCARRLRDPADAEDACQETFLKLARKAGQVRSNVAAWLHRAATTTCLDMIRADARRRRHELRSARPATSAQGDLDAQTLTAHVDEALGELDEATRQLLIERFLMDQKQNELAAARGLSEATVSRRVQGGLERLRGILKDKGVAAPAGALAAGLTAIGAETAGAAPPAGLTATLAKIGLSGVGGAAGLNVGVVLAVVLALAAAVGGGLLALQRPSAPPSGAAAPVSTSAWSPAGPMSLAMDGWWQVPTDVNDDDGIDIVLTVDALRGEVTLSQLGGSIGPGHVTYRIDDTDRGLATVIENTIDPGSVGMAAPLRLSLLSDNRLQLTGSPPGADPDAAAASSIVLERVGPSTVLTRTDAPRADQRPRLRVGTSRIWFQNASLRTILDLNVNYFNNPYRTEMRAALPQGGFDVDLDLGDSEFGRTMSARYLLHRALLRDHGIRIRTEKREMDVYHLRVPDGGAVKLTRPAEGDMRVGGIDVVGDQRVWHGHQLGSLGRSIEWELDRPVVDDTGLGDAKFRFVEPWPRPPGHDKAAYFLETSGLELVPGRAEVEVTIIENVSAASDRASWPTMPRPWGMEMAPWSVEPLEDLVAKAGPAPSNPPSIDALQGYWEEIGRDGGMAFHIIDDLIVASGSRQAYIRQLDHWPASARALMRPRREREQPVDVWRITQADERKDGLLLTAGHAQRMVHMLVRIEGDQMRLGGAQKGSAPDGWDDPELEIRLFRRTGPSPLAERVRALRSGSR